MTVRAMRGGHRWCEQPCGVVWVRLECTRAAYCCRCDDAAWAHCNQCCIAYDVSLSDAVGFLVDNDDGRILEVFRIIGSIE